MAPSASQEAEDKSDLKRRFIQSIYERDYVKRLLNDKPEHALAAWLRSLEVISVERTSDTTSRVIYRFKVLRQYMNPHNSLHGGLSSGMYDTATSLSLWVIRKPGFWMSGGVSRSLNITFLRPAAEGEALLLESEVVHAGKRLCLINAVLRREKDGALVSTCEHQKYNTDADSAKA